MPFQSKEILIYPLILSDLVPSLSLNIMVATLQNVVKHRLICLRAVSQLISLNVVNHFTVNIQWLEQNPTGGFIAPHSLVQVVCNCFSKLI